MTDETGPVIEYEEQSDELAPEPIVIEASSLEAAIKEAEKQFDVKKSRLNQKILTKGKSGFMGIGSVLWKVEFTLKKKKTMSLASIQNTLLEATDLLANKDGHFSFECEGDSVYLIVHPPEGEGVAVDLDSVVREIRRPGVKKVDHDAIRIAIECGDPANRARIADFDHAKEFNKDAEIKLRVSDDKMSVFLKAENPIGTGKHPMLEAVLELLNQTGIKMEPNREAIRDYFTIKDYSKELLIVTALPPSEPQNGYIKWTFDSEKSETPTNRADIGRMLKIDNVSKGDTIGEIIPPMPGMDGIDVYGESITAKNGQPVRYAMGQNVEESPDGKFILSTIDGQVVLKGNTPNVFPLFEVFGDVTLNTGNIDFIGNVMIHGNVGDGKEIKAEGSIIVKGNVERSRLESGDSIFIEGGILGKEKGLVMATRNVTCKFAENANIHTGESVICEKGLINCQVTAGKKVHSRTSGGGVIVGGQVMAGDEIEADVIGSPMGTKTIVVVGIDISRQESLNRFLVDISKLEEHQNKVSKLAKLLSKNDTRNPEEEKLYRNATVTLQQLTEKLQRVYQQKEKMENDMEVNRRGVIRAHKMIHPDVWVRIRRGYQRIDTEIKASAIGYDGENMRILPL